MIEYSIGNGLEMFLLVMMGTFLYFHDANKPIGTTGCEALFSAIRNAINEAPVPANKPIMTGEVQA